MNEWISEFWGKVVVVVVGEEGCVALLGGWMVDWVADVLCV